MKITEEKEKGRMQRNLKRVPEVVIEGGGPRKGRTKMVNLGGETEITIKKEKERGRGGMQRNLKRVMGLGRKRVETIKEVGITVKEEKEMGKSQRNLKRARIKMTGKKERKKGTIMMEVVV